jgi:AraC-like DNA-binding protein
MSAFGIGLRHKHRTAPRLASTARLRSPHVRRVCAYIRTHYGEPISLESLAKGVGRNTAYLATLFRRETGMTIHRYLTGIRMQRAARLLRQREKVEAVMLLVGYRSKKNFYRQFAAAFGVTPGQFKANPMRPRTR